MKKIVFTIISLTLIFITNSYAYDNNDFQIWNTDSQEFTINDKTKLNFEEEFRWADNAGEFYYHHYDNGLVYSLYKWLNIGGGYRQIYELKNRKFKLENAPYLSASIPWSLAGFKFENRLRAEYRHFDYQPDSWRYRNKITIKSPWKITKLEIQPYISDEAFISFGGTNQINQNRLSCGFSMSLTKNLKAETYYLLQKARNSKGKWIASNILGTKIKLIF